MTPMQEAIAIRNPQHAIQFVGADLAASQSGTALHLVATSGTAKIDVQQLVAPWPGYVIAISATLSANKTAGALSFTPTINGTAVGVSCSVADSTRTARGYAAGVYRFAAGDLLGCVYTTDSSYAPTTLDAAVEVYVVYEDVYF